MCQKGRRVCSWNFANNSLIRIYITIKLVKSQVLYWIQSDTILAFIKNERRQRDGGAELA